MTPKEYLSANQTVSIKKTADGKETIVKQTNPKALENLRKVEKGFENALAKTRENLKNNLPKSTNGYNTSYYDYPSLNYALTQAEKGTNLSHTHNLKVVRVPLGNGSTTPRFFAFTVLQYQWLTLILNGVPLQKGVKRTKTTTPSQAFDGTITSAERYSLMATFGIGPSQNFDNNNNGNVNNANASGNAPQGNGGNIQGGNIQNGNIQGGNIQGGNFNQAGANLNQNTNSEQGQPINTRSNSTTVTQSNSVNSQATSSSASSSNSSSKISLSSSSVKSASKTSSAQSSVANHKSAKSSESGSSSKTTVKSSATNSASAKSVASSNGNKPKTTKKPQKITPAQRARAIKLQKTMKYIKKRNPILKTTELLNMIFAVTHIKTPKGLNTMTPTQCAKAIHIVKTFLPKSSKTKKK